MWALFKEMVSEGIAGLKQQEGAEHKKRAGLRPALFLAATCARFSPPGET